ncbi:unnamed protein product [Rotaria sordida]|uniref:Uncharacterized protein n=1 Tax=Rotaria sordida TaxID=392033 RepID=A0A819N0M1_9BILA|nr:unnamed protein product [Rotaria sordida]CAF3987901.1 unnamed protein product [Rotaria sordida]
MMIKVTLKTDVIHYLRINNEQRFTSISILKEKLGEHSIFHFTIPGKYDESCSISFIKLIEDRFSLCFLNRDTSMIDIFEWKYDQNVHMYCRLVHPQFDQRTTHCACCIDGPIINKLKFERLIDVKSAQTTYNISDNSFNDNDLISSIRITTNINK